MSFGDFVLCPLPPFLLKESLCLQLVFTKPLHPPTPHPPVSHRAGLSLSVAYRLNQSCSGSLQTELALAQSPLEVSTSPAVCLSHWLTFSFMLLFSPFRSPSCSIFLPLFTHSFSSNSTIYPDIYSHFSTYCVFNLWSFFFFFFSSLFLSQSL